MNKLVPTTKATCKLKDPSSPPAAKAEKTSEELFPKARRVTPATVYWHLSVSEIYFKAGDK